MKLETNNVTVKKSQKELFQFLSKLENFEQLMPENIEKFEVDGDSFIFGLKGMPEIRLILKDQTEFNQVVLGAASSKFPFTLTANIEEIDSNTAKAKLDFNGSFNPMVAMMIKSPLKKFINTLSENIEKL